MTLQTPWRAPREAVEDVKKERVHQKGEKLEPAQPAAGLRLRGKLANAAGDARVQGSWGRGSLAGSRSAIAQRAGGETDCPSP